MLTTAQRKEVNANENSQTKSQYRSISNQCHFLWKMLQNYRKTDEIKECKPKKTTMRLETQRENE